MGLWNVWLQCVWQLKAACARKRTFFWMIVFLMGITVRGGDMMGVTSIVRVLGIYPSCYDRILDFLHSRSLCLDKLTLLWTKLVLKLFASQLLQINGRYVLAADGLKMPKEGRRMPAVRSLHQSSDSNSKAEYIMGHSFQSIAILSRALNGIFAVPLISRIHEGLVFANFHTQTLYDKLLRSLDLLGRKDISYYLVADAYYSVSKMVRGLLERGNHLITRAKRNAVGYQPVAKPSKTKRGRPKKYGNKIKLNSLFNEGKKFVSAKSPLYGERNTEIRFRSINLLWRPAGVMVQFVAVIHPHRGKILLMCTDLELDPVEIIRLYGFRFKIEVSFKQAVHTVGTYTYHFWMRAMDTIKRKSGDQYLHHKSEKYREAVKRKMAVYHKYVQLGLVAQGLLQYLSCFETANVWKKFGSWVRTIRLGIPPSEKIAATALKNSLCEFLATPSKHETFKKFLYERIDIERTEGMRLVA